MFEEGLPTLLNFSFWMEYVKTKTVAATSFSELSFWNYLRFKPFWYKMKNELEFVPPSDWLVQWLKTHPSKEST